MDLVTDFATVQDSVSQALISTTRVTSQLAAQDLAFYRSLEPQIGRLVDRQCARLLQIAKKTLISCCSSEPNGCNLVDVESIDNNWNSIVDVADDLLERADTALDEFHGLIERPVSHVSDGKPHHGNSPGLRKGYMFNAHALPKPQLLFDHVTNNNDEPPFRPLLTSKPHAILSLEQSLEMELSEDATEFFPHPYQQEISNYKYPPLVYNTSDPVSSTPFGNTQATLVSDIDGLILMLEELKKAPLIAIDLEHHDTHSYNGIVCLMQISTRDHDWIVDTLKPWRRKLEILNEVFANPNIVKVLHGAFMDVIWLQRDFGLYIVGLFDTHHAARVLGYPGGSLAYLLKRFADFDAQKQYQTADWRIRPLPQEMFEYAQSDTHFLLNIFDNMRNELVEQSIGQENHDGEDSVEVVLERSKKTAMQRYEYPTYDFDTGLGRYGWFEQLQRAPIVLSREQFSAFREVHRWRDRLARKEDESPHHIMSKQVLTSIVQVLPRDEPSLKALLTHVSPLVRLHSHELFTVIQDAISKGAKGPEMHELLNQAYIKIEASSSRRSNSSFLTGMFNNKASVSTGALHTDVESCRATTSGLWGSTLNVRATCLTSELQFTIQCDLQNKIAAGPSSMRPAQILDDSTNDPEPTPGITASVDEGRSWTTTIHKDNVNGKRKRSFDSMREKGNDVPVEKGSEHEVTTPAFGVVEKLQPLSRRYENKTISNEMFRDKTEITISKMDDLPYDYGNAPRVLRQEQSILRPTSNIESTPFNPYQFSNDMNPGRRTTKESKLSKSSTFKR